MEHKITVTVSDEELQKMKASLEEMTGRKITDPLKLLKFMLQDDATNADVYADNRFDSGGNSEGDVLTEEQVAECFGSKEE